MDAGPLWSRKSNGEKAVYFIGPKAGGTEVVHGGQTVLVITPESPLGKQLMGQKQGDVLKLTLANAQNQCRVNVVA